MPQYVTYLSLPAAEAHPQRSNKLQIGRQCWRLESLEVNLRGALRKGPACSAALPGTLARWTGDLPSTSTILNYSNVMSPVMGRAWSSAASMSARLKHLQPSCRSRVKGSMSFHSCSTPDQGKSTPQMLVLNFKPLYTRQSAELLVLSHRRTLDICKLQVNFAKAESKSIESISKAKSFKL